MQLTPKSFKGNPVQKVRACFLSAATMLALFANDLSAQGLFAPVLTVNDAVVTQFEFEQRIQFIGLLGIPGNPVESARQELIDDRLKLQAAKAAGITVTPEEIDAGIEELSTRTELSAEEFIKALEQGGVAVETLRDFAEVNVAWRKLIQAKYLAQARPTDAEIDNAVGSAGGGSGVRVLLSEIIIPVTEQTVDQVSVLADQLSQITTYDGFSEAAGKYSASQSRNNGGRLNWLDLNDLPQGFRPIVLALTPGEITAPIPLPDAVALFQMRDIKESNVTAPRYTEIDYAMFFIPGGRTAEALGQASKLAGQVDTCDDLYGIARDLPPERLERISQKPSQIPRDIAVELAKLDDGEISTTLTRSNGQTLVFLMMCGRTTPVGEEATREEVANALVDQRLTTSADSYLDQLRANAVVVDK